MEVKSIVGLHPGYVTLAFSRSVLSLKSFFRPRKSTRKDCFSQKARGNKELSGTIVSSRIEGNSGYLSLTLCLWSHLWAGPDRSFDLDLNTIVLSQIWRLKWIAVSPLQHLRVS